MVGDVRNRDLVLIHFLLLIQTIAKVVEGSIEDYEEGMKACSEAAQIWMQVRCSHIITSALIFLLSSKISLSCVYMLIIHKRMTFWSSDWLISCCRFLHQKEGRLLDR